MVSFQEYRPELVDEWDYTKNDKNPSEVSYGSAKKYWWICPVCGNKYQAAVCHRVRGTACPECAKENKTSFGEQAIYYYLSKVLKANNRWNEIGSEVDVFLPELNLGIEYDGELYHFGEKALKREKKKYNSLKELGIKLIRVKENIKKNKIISYADLTIEITTQQWDKEFEQVISKIIRFINENWNLNLELDIDIKRDRQDIYSQYIKQRKENSVLNKYPELIKDWDYSKNKIKPESLTPGSSKIIWWMCEKGHSYSSTLANHIKGHGCSYCSNQKALSGYNDLLTKYPEIAKDWDYDKNKITPDKVLPFTNKRYYWKCEKGHSYLASPNARCSKVKHAGCSICSGRQVLKGYNDIKTLRPKVAKEWDYEKNKKTPEEYTISSDEKVWWACPKGHSYKAVIHSRARLENGTGCPICAGKEILLGYNDFKSQRPDLLIEWNYEKNNKIGIYPDKVHVTSMKRVWWKCHQCGNEWKATLYARCRKNQGCNVCSSIIGGQKHIDKLIKEQGSLKDNCPALLKEWDYDKNTIIPEMVTIGSHKRAFWICSNCGHKWSTEIRVRAMRKNGCPKCRNKII